MKKKPDFSNPDTAFEQLTLEMFINQSYQISTTEPKDELVEQNMVSTAELTDKV